MKLFDSLSNSHKFLTDTEEITIYLCGPTLYKQLHLGNLRPIIIFDFLIRYLRHQGIPHHYIQNLTDIDEKILKQTVSEKRKVKELTNQYFRSFISILKNLNIIFPHNLPSVSENIEEIQRIIECLIKLGKAKGDKSTQTIKFLQSEKNENLNYFSNNVYEELTEADFALGKENKLSTFNFNSPGFMGIPGWHIECFAIIQKYFNLPITIHGGGVDLKFPHHENANLLSRSLFQKDLAEIGIHVGQVLNEQGKLSKSSNLQFSIEECASSYSWSFLRYIFMKTKYHKPITLSQSILMIYGEEGKTYISALLYSEAVLSNSLEAQGIKIDKLNSPDKKVIELLETNLNLPKILSGLEELKFSLLTALREKNLKNISEYSHKLRFHLKGLGFTISSISEEQRKQFNNGVQLLEQRDYVKADKLRSQLQSECILP